VSVPWPAFLGHVRQLALHVEPIGIVARTAGKGIQPRLAIEDVVAAVARQLIVLAVAGAVAVGVPGEHEVFQIGAQREAYRRLNAIDSTGGARFADGVGHVVHHVDIVAIATAHRVCTGAAVEKVVAAVARQDIRTTQTVQHVVPQGAGQPVRCLVAGDRPARDGNRVVIDDGALRA
jgi:hypothetical protein